MTKQNSKCDYWGCSSEPSKESNVPEWEKDFANDFRDSFAGGDMYNWERATPIIDFIRRRIASETAKERERCVNRILRYAPFIEKSILARILAAMDIKSNE